MNSYKYDNTMDSDVLAVAHTTGGTVTLLVVPQSAIYGKDYDIVMWNGDEIHIGVAKEYLDDVVHDRVAIKTLNHIRSLCGENMESALENKKLSGVVSHFAHDFFISEMRAIVLEITDLALSAPDELSFDESLNALLEGDTE